MIVADLLAKRYSCSRKPRDGHCPASDASGVKPRTSSRLWLQLRSLLQMAQEKVVNSLAQR
jgi:hypothetical protein